MPLPSGSRPSLSEPEGAPAARSLLLLPLSVRDAVAEVLVLADEEEREFEPDEVEVAAAFAGAAAASLEQLRLGEQLAARVARESALSRAAQALNESLDLPRLLASIAREATAILDADVAAVWRGDAKNGVAVEAVHGFPPEVIGYRLEPGEGLAGRVAQLGRPILVDDYAHMIPPDSPFTGVECVLGAPMRWDGELHGVLAVGYLRPHVGSEDHLRVLETFAELASVACRNASVHAGLAHAARTDGLTGCLNHAALHEALRREVERARRTGQPLGLVLIDLDDFKQVNERHGHLVGDEVLRRVGQALRSTLRPYDHVARYGGDEFAMVVVDAGENEAAETADRAVVRLSAALADFAGDWPSGPGGGRATAGVAEWDPSMSATELLASADRALLFGKQEHGRRVIHASTLPETFHPGRFGGPAPIQPVERDMGVDENWAAAGRQQLDRLRRRTRGLAIASGLGARLVGLGSADEVLETAVAELHRSFAWDLVAILRLREDDYVEVASAGGGLLVPGSAHAYSQPRSAGLIGRCLRERQPVLCTDVTRDPDYRGSELTKAVRSEVCVPVRVGDSLWGALNVESVDPDAFDEDDVRLLQTVAEHVGAALGVANRLERLERRLGL